MKSSYKRRLLAKFCIDHRKKMLYYCKNCNCELCGECYLLHDSDHIVVYLSSDRRYLSQRIELHDYKGHKYFVNSVKHYPCHYKLWYHLSVYNFITKDDFTVNMPKDFFFGAEGMCATIGTKIYYVPLARGEYNLPINIDNTKLHMLELTNFPLKSVELHRSKIKQDIVALCELCGKYIYLFGRVETVRYSIISGKVAKMPPPIKDDSYSRFAYKPLLFQNRYLLGIRENMKTLQIYLLDVLDEERGWVHTRTIVPHKLNLKYYEGDCMVTMGSNRSILFVNNEIIVLEYNVYENAAQAIINANINRYSSDDPLVGSPTHHGGYAYISKYRGNILQLSYARKTYNVINPLLEYVIFDVV